MRLSAFDTYCLFLALKNHFTRDSYDFFRYRGKVTASHDSFMSRKDRFQFQKLSRLHSEDSMRDFIVSNIIAGKTWVGDFLDDDAEDNYKKHLKVNQSLSYIFANELDALFSESRPNICFRAYKDRYPTAFMHHLSGDVSIETMVILNDFVRYISKWDSVYSDDSLWPKHSLLIKKYTPFLEYDKDKMKSILKDKLKEYEYGDREEQEASRASSIQSANAA
jgi:hypothetical protein